MTRRRFAEPPCTTSPYFVLTSPLDDIGTKHRYFTALIFHLSLSKFSIALAFYLVGPKIQAYEF